MAGLTCEHCDTPVAVLLALHLRGVPHGESGHNTVHDYRDIHACEGGHGWLKVFSHDCFHLPWDEEWDMAWSWELTEGSLDVLRSGFAECPDWLDPDCVCPAHVGLRDRWGWNGHKPGVTTVAIRLIDDLPKFVDAQR
ncbi:hypothetical protein [Alloactinosynnema sp. L-07]|uniref:hypothetical protein n=1 Tax=Alloactinosynnema sp. L-07 TaxID=1653480 RepID=UPI00065EF02C|nr:hypothetical protein [Alloactinosynnema sp. L-07]CRK60197.1 hypothetical protein [Alloactinosynnema sp. L-07]